MKHLKHIHLLEIILSLHIGILLFSCETEKNVHTNSLRNLFSEQFLIGTAVNSDQILGKDTNGVNIIKQHFNSIVAENCMKCENIHPEENRYDFSLADKFVEFGMKNNMEIIGHCLIWHSQLPDWFCTDEQGHNVTPDILKKRMKEHITTVVSRYKGKIKGWDVVNEAIIEDGSYRKSKFYEILGEEFIPLAFQYAHEADPNAELYYNDYGMNIEGRRDGVVRLIKSLKERKLRIDAVGMQGHMGMDYPSLKDFEASIKAFSDTGVKVMITEWDMSALPTVNQTSNISDTVAFNHSVNPYPDNLPQHISQEWNQRMKSFFNLFLKHSDVITRVTVWGVNDNDSWKNDFPVNGRKDYPLLFDREYKPKPFIKELLSPKAAVFDSFIYEVPGDSNNNVEHIQSNPILPGCHPDPSICRVGNDYFLINSSFAYFPGVPIWHSTDLKNWNRLGYVLNRPSQLPLDEGIHIREGIYAPDIKYNPYNKKFYMITTHVGGNGNFFVTTDDPKSNQWSEPVFLPEIGGIDPGILFDTDGKAYIVNNDAPEGKEEYEGHRAIWIREFDWKNNRTKGEARMIIDGGLDKRQKPIWIEGPHLYHINGKYYLMAAEGGTGKNHSEVIFYSYKPFGPYRPCQINPILTQRNLPEDRESPVTCTGHADLVQTPDGEWYAVFLGVRPYKEEHDLMGRETFMLPVEWQNEQPVILQTGKAVSYQKKGSIPEQLWSSKGLSEKAFFIRTPYSNNHKILSDGKLQLTAGSTKLYEYKNPSVIGRWITEWNFQAKTSLAFSPEANGDFAGLVLFQNDDCYIRFGKILDPQKGASIKLEAYSKGSLYENIIIPLSEPDIDRKIYLKIEGDEQVCYTFSYSFEGREDWIQLEKTIPADILSTQTAGGFTGTMIGICAIGNYNE